MAVDMTRGRRPKSKPLKKRARQQMEVSSDEESTEREQEDNPVCLSYPELVELLRHSYPNEFYAGKVPTKARGVPATEAHKSAYNSYYMAVYRWCAKVGLTLRTVNRQPLTDGALLYSKLKQKQIPFSDMNSPENTVRGPCRRGKRAQTAQRQAPSLREGA